MKIYREFKEDIKEEKMYENSYASVLLFRARTNCLNVFWRKRFCGEDGVCLLCQTKEETLKHFLRRCESLRPQRNEHDVTDSLPMSEMLLFGEGKQDEIQGRKKYLVDIWKKRKALLEHLNDEQA